MVDYAKGDVEHAKLYKEEMGFTYLDGDRIRRYGMCVDNHKLRSFGIGIYFYLDYFKSFAKLLFFMSLFMGV